MYLSLGEGRHVDELRFSVLSAARFAPGGWDVRLYTDRPDAFAGLPVSVRHVDDATAAGWSGTAGYVYRSKIEALAETLRSPGVQRAAIIDGDTYFTRSPAELFAGVSPARTVMHLREGRPAPPEVAALEQVLSRCQPVDLAGVPWGMTSQETLWNSGVVALHTVDVDLCAEVAHLTDQLLDQGFAEFSHTAEMVAFGVVLGRRTLLGECHGAVTHYWQTELRSRFRPLLQQAWADPSLRQDEAFDRLWRRRPRLGPSGRAKFVAKRLAAKVGVER
ncbi:MAG: hypothetical protein JWN08_3109 [Frankiales bacterium]|nr:hypothetical protein [Frankiales bacterium]